MLLVKTKVIKCILMAGLVCSSHVNAWIISADFESGIPGSEASGNDAFGNPFESTHTTDIAKTGKQSAKLLAYPGQKTFGHGGSFNFPQKVKQGEELWVRAYIYYPADFDYTAGGVGLKTLRVIVEQGDGSHAGAVDLLTAGGSLTAGIEFWGSDKIKKGVGSKAPHGKWQALEYYIKFHSTPGQGIYRVWQDGNLVYEEKNRETLPDPNATANFFLLYSFWNSAVGNDGAPKRQNNYVDNIVITTETPSQKDEKGNRIIGLIEGASVPLKVRPSAPVLDPIQ